MIKIKSLLYLTLPKNPIPRIQPVFFLGPRRTLPEPSHNPPPWTLLNPLPSLYLPSLSFLDVGSRISVEVAALNNTRPEPALK